MKDIISHKQKSSEIIKLCGETYLILMFLVSSQMQHRNHEPPALRWDWCPGPLDGVASLLLRALPSLFHLGTCPWKVHGCAWGKVVRDLEMGEKRLLGVLSSFCLDYLCLSFVVFGLFYKSLNCRKLRIMQTSWPLEMWIVPSGDSIDSCSVGSDQPFSSYPPCSWCVSALGLPLEQL